MLALLYALAMLVMLVYGLNLLWMALRLVRAEGLRPGPVPDPDRLPVPDGRWPTVTVQLPLYNEAYVAERLLDACAALTYPRHRLQVQVLDDSTDETTAIVARRVAYWQAQGLDVAHVRRAARAGYKAGALQHGLATARGELVALFDADFVPPPSLLQALIPAFDAPDVGMVQARWGHLNADDALLTRIQALGLDAHFAVEQQVRSLAGCFINFNGTAGIWRRRCIDDAGGWQGDTLAEDLDLSYRAQLRGWRLRYLHDVEVPAELPVDMNALRVQQYRWTKGAAETALKLLRPLWRARLPLRVKVEGTFHLTAPVVFPCVLLAALLHAPLLLLEAQGRGPGPAYFAALGLGLAGFAGFLLAQVLAQRALYPDWGRRLRLLPLFLAGSMGLALSNARALALLRRPTAFERTPKHGDRREAGRRAWWRSRYAERRLPVVAWGEAALALYCLAGVVATAAVGAWAALPFQSLFALCFGLVTAFNVQQYRLARQR